MNRADKEGMILLDIEQEFMNNTRKKILKCYCGLNYDPRNKMEHINNEKHRKFFDNHLDRIFEVFWRNKNKV